MALLQFHKVASLPGTLQADSFYFVQNGNYAEGYLTNSAGEAKSIGNSTMINALITEALSSLPTSGAPLIFVADIAARDALEEDLTGPVFVVVTDATGDPTVTAGAALYGWNPTLEGWVKLAEYESMDVTLTWETIQGKPTSTPSQIDDTVTKAHTHTNKSTLDKFSEAGGLLRFNGSPIPAEWDGVNW
ncbi:hypothetical protein [Pseudomonas tohonis]|uniref:hypothetical protein n=1 Tax=Pseudomonas tohonis TaxID=2725477 RepID=UPI001F27765A|nr:hypothetical protein [Pseudomonas tohonis]GJN49431.1 hypothetical protein TUM20249_54170 [Pseudomonas tohonis]